MNNRQYKISIHYVTLDMKFHTHSTKWYSSPKEAWNEAHEFETKNLGKWLESSSAICSRKVY